MALLSDMVARMKNGAALNARDMASFQLCRSLRCRQGGRLEERNPVAPLRLGGIHRLISSLLQRLHGLVVVGAAGHADAGGHAQRATLISAYSARAVRRSCRGRRASTFKACRSVS